MDQLTSQGCHVLCFNGFDKDDSTWVEKRLDDCFGRRARCVKWNRKVVEDLSALNQIANLQEVFITNSQIKDLSGLSGIESVKLIDLIGSDVDDLTPLCKLPNLTYLNVNRTQVTDAQATGFAIANPRCTVLHSSTIDEDGSPKKLSDFDASNH
jgi:Leucine-rich repeat (LRR) protein